MSDLLKDPMILRQIIMDHYEYPRNHTLTKEEGYAQKHMASESCIDDIYVQSRIEEGIVKDVRFDGVACTISTASTSIMSELLRGKSIAQAREIIRNYFLKDFFKDHCKAYQKRPIYWLFDSGKQNGFKALIYLHRYTTDTIGNLRVDYLHKMQRVYESEINRMQDMIDHSTNAREVAASAKRKEKLQKQLKECRDYDEMIAHLALSRTELDLDDGVKVNYEKIQTASDGKKYAVLAKI